MTLGFRLCHRRARFLRFSGAVFNSLLGMVRAEGRYKARKLARDNRDRVSLWTPDTAGQLLRRELRNLRMNASAELPPAVVAQMTRDEKKYYYAWKCGEDMRAFCGSRSTFNVYHKQLKNYGIDISIQNQPEFFIQNQTLNGTNSVEITNLPFEIVITPDQASELYRHIVHQAEKRQLQEVNIT